MSVSNELESPAHLTNISNTSFNGVFLLKNLFLLHYFRSLAGFLFDEFGHENIFTPSNQPELNQKERRIGYKRNSTEAALTSRTINM